MQETAKNCTIVDESVKPPLPNSGDEANLAKWGWPSPALLVKHGVKKGG